MHNVRADTITGQGSAGDTPRQCRTTTVVRDATLAAIRKRGRRHAGGWLEVGQNAIASELQHPDGSSYTTRHVRNAVADLRGERRLKVQRARRAPDGRGGWRTVGCDRYRVVDNRKRAGRTERKWIAGRSPNGELDEPLSGSRSSLVECLECGVPFPRGKEPPDRTCAGCR